MSGGEEEVRSFSETRKLGLHHPLIYHPESSETIKRYGIPWSFKWGYNNHLAYVKLNCEMGMHSNLWSIDYKFTATLRTSPTDSSTVSGDSSTVSGVFDHQTTSANIYNLGGFLLMQQSLFNDNYQMSDNTITIKVDILKTRGLIRKRKANFDLQVGGFHDVCLIAEDKRFYESKAFLSSFSPVFTRMFCGRFKESKEDEVKLEQVSASTLELFLCILHSWQAEITDNNCEILLEFADRFDTEKVVRKVLKFLKGSSQLPIEKKLQLAERFKDAQLQQIAFDSLKSFNDIECLTKNMKDMSEANSKALLMKTISLWKRQNFYGEGLIHFL